MAETKIEWTATTGPDGQVHPGFTMNPWLGCQKVSPACTHCYAESWSKQRGRPMLWRGERRRTSAATWRKPLLWNNQAGQLGVRLKVFCASLADVFELPPTSELQQEMLRWREDLWKLIEACDQLDWLLLTKRPHLVRAFVPQDWLSPGRWPRHVWLGTTVENQEYADQRIPHLLSVPAAVRFLSMEPLLGPVDLSGPLGLAEDYTGPEVRADGQPYDPQGSLISWVISGAESGPSARPTHPDWARALRDQCKEADVPFFWKQWGELLPDCQVTEPGQRVRETHHSSPHNPAKLNRYWRTGKVKSGALLDGLLYREMPR